MKFTHRTRRGLSAQSVLDELDKASLSGADISPNRVSVNNSKQGERLSVGGGLRLANKRPKFIVTHISDDSSLEDYTKVFPVFQAKGKVGTLAVVTEWIQQGTTTTTSSFTNVLTEAQLAEMANAGWEIASHTHTHPHLATLNDSQVLSELDTAKNILNGWGYHARNFAAPFGSTNVNVRRFIRDFHRSNRAHTGGQTYNLSPVETYSLSQFDFDYGAHQGEPLSFYTNFIDQAISEAVTPWIIFTHHPWDVSENYETILADLLDYTDAQGGETLTLDDALDVYGNLVDVGDPESEDYFAVSGFGRQASVFTGLEETAIGKYSPKTPGTRSTYVGAEAGLGNNSIPHNTGIGFRALINQGVNGSANVGVGRGAGGHNTGRRSVFVGNDSGLNNGGSEVVGVGDNSLSGSTRDNVVGVGYHAANGNTGATLSALGWSAGLSNSGHDCSGVGGRVLQSNSGSEAVAIGFGACRDNSGNNVVAVGFNAANGNTISSRFLVEHRTVSTNPLIDGSFSTGGIALGAPSTANKLADTRIGANRMTFYLDEAENKLHFRVKYADGTTIKEGEVNLV